MEQSFETTETALNTYKALKRFIDNPAGSFIGSIINPCSEIISKYQDYELDIDEFENIENNVFKYYYEDNIYELNLYNNNIFIDGKPMSRDIGYLISISQPSLFGNLHTDTNDFNPEIRMAWEITNERITFSDDFTNKLERIKLDVQKELYNNNEIYFELNKMNLYESSCFFKSHVDTPQENMIGTLVITILQNKYDDGGLFINGNKIYSNCVAFYGDVPHEVKELTTNRITLTFYIKSHSSLQFNYNDAYNNYINKYYNDLDYENDKFGIVCKYKYSISEMNNNMIKAEDQILVNYLKEKLDKEYIFVPVLVEQKEEFNNEESEFVNIKNVYLLDMTNNFNNIDINNIKFLSYNGYKYGEEIMFEEDDSGYTGNEVIYGGIEGRYFTTAIIFI